MTKMIDILEDFMNLRKYTFFRLDGASNIADRRDMVNDFQKPQSKVFVFLLSTRAGIFYNLHRWTGCNPDCSQYSHLLRQRLEPHYGCSSNRQSSQNRPEQRRERLSVGHEGNNRGENREASPAEEDSPKYSLRGRIFQLLQEGHDPGADGGWVRSRCQSAWGERRKEEVNAAEQKEGTEIEEPKGIEGVKSGEGRHPIENLGINPRINKCE